MIRHARKFTQLKPGLNIFIFTACDIRLPKLFPTTQMLDVAFEFLHADEFKTQYPFENASKLPAVFRRENNGLELMISADEINSCRTARDLEQVINAQLNN